MDDFSKLGLASCVCPDEAFANCHEEIYLQKKAHVQICGFMN